MAVASVCSLIFARSATVFTPHSASRRSSEGPMPGMPRSGIICTNSACRATGISSMPSGFAFVDAIFATSLFAATPTEQVTWNREATSCRIQAPIRVGRCQASSAPDTSIYASSTETCSNRSVTWLNTSSMMRRDIIR